MTKSHRSYSLLALGFSAILVTAALAQQAAAPVGAQAVVQDIASGTTAQTLRVGEQVDMDRLHRISRPGLYGMSQSPAGSSYGVLDGRLIRYDSSTLRVQSIIRQIDVILD